MASNQNAGAARRRVNNFCLDAAEFCHWNPSPGRDMRTLKACFGQWRENFRNLWREKCSRTTSRPALRLPGLKNFRSRIRHSMLFIEKQPEVMLFLNLKNADSFNTSPGLRRQPFPQKRQLACEAGIYEPKNRHHCRTQWHRQDDQFAKEFLPHEADALILSTRKTMGDNP